MISKRDGKANNKHMKQRYDPSKPSEHLLYIDANNLYGWSMSQPLQDSKFEWISDSEWQKIDWHTQTDDQDAYRKHRRVRLGLSGQSPRFLQ